jgi:hypothetical protein
MVLNYKHSCSFYWSVNDKKCVFYNIDARGLHYIIFIAVINSLL